MQTINNLKLITKLHKELKVLKAVAFATYKEWVVYRSHMAVSLFVGPIFFLVQYFIWTAVYSTQSSIKGLSLEQMLTYYGIAAIISYITYDSADWNLQMLISSGKFLTFMLRPVSHLYFAFSQKVGHRLLGFWVEFLPISLLFFFVFKINLIPAYPFWAILSILLSFIMIFLISYCLGISAFWLTRTSGIRRMFRLIADICAGVFIPLTFFPDFAQKILFFLPFQYMTYVPIRVFIGSYSLGGVSMSIPQIVGIQALAVICMYLFTKLLWHLGFKKFTGVGA